MSALAMLGRDIYMRHTNTGGGSYVQTHRVWDADRFVAAQQREAANLNATATKEDAKAPALAKAEQITEEQYRKDRA